MDREVEARALVGWRQKRGGCWREVAGAGWLRLNREDPEEGGDRVELVAAARRDKGEQGGPHCRFGGEEADDDEQHVIGEAADEVQARRMQFWLKPPPLVGCSPSISAGGDAGVHVCWCVLCAGCARVCPFVHAAA